jgi:tetratricopeptide (TPR) repeat protein
VRTPTATLPPTVAALAHRLDDVDALVREAERLMATGKSAQAVPVWDRIIALVPDDGEARYQRGLSYRQLLNNNRVQAEYQDYLDRALADFDTAIALGPATGDWYLMRSRTLYDLAWDQPYRSDFDVYAELALENKRVAVALGTSDDLADRDIGLMLARLGRCDESLAHTQRLMEELPASQRPSAGLNTILAEGYLCAGQTTRALEAIDLAVATYDSAPRRYTRAVILYNLGRTDEALAELDQLIERSPYYNGHRYYLRALIHYERGQRDLAEADLAMGAGNSWASAELYAYVTGRMAFDDGDAAAGAAYLQEAEASMPRYYGPLLTRVQGELRARGIPRIAANASVWAPSTPIPTPLAMAPVPTLGTGAHGSCAADATPAPPSIAVALETGSGPMVLAADDYPLFHFVAPPGLQVRAVRALTWHMQSDSPPANHTLQLMLWVTDDDGGWRQQEPLVWGRNPVELWPSHVTCHGDIYVGLRNYGDQAVAVDNLGFTLVVEQADGTVATYGLPDAEAGGAP